MFVLLAGTLALVLMLLNRPEIEVSGYSPANTPVAASGTLATAVLSPSPTLAPTLAPTSPAQSSPPTPILQPVNATTTEDPTPTLAAPPTTMTVTAVLTIPATPNTLPTRGLPDMLPTPNGIYSYTLRVPILMYHYISVPPPDADIYRYDLSVTPDNFRQQMAYLAENGFTPIDLYDLSLAITGHITLPDKPVILTFDDGYLDNYQNALPVLQDYGFTATFFVITDYIDQNAQGYATWPMLEEMAAAGMRIESHSRNHPDLSGKGRDFLIWQMLGSQETLAAHLGYTPKFFCYPSGRYDATAITVLTELGFWGAVTTQGGKWHGFNDRYEWTRVRLHHDTTLPEFMDLVNPGNTQNGIVSP